MKLKIGINNLGVSLGAKSDNNNREKCSRPVPDQTKPKKFYVYGHYDVSGNLFYVGKGIANRAWSKDRHPLWTRYVDKHLGGKYTIKILADDLTADEAEELEAELIAEQSDRLVNWENMGRALDFNKLDKYHTLRDTNHKLLQDTRKQEGTDLNLAVQNYRVVIKKMEEYVFIDFEQGLVSQLLKEDNDEFGRSGELEALDRLTLCLVKLGRVSEAAEETATYFACYKRDQILKAAEKIKRRVEKALARYQKQNKEDKT